MAPITSTENKHSPIILVSLLIASLIGGYFYYVQVLKPEALPIQTGVSATDTLSKFKDLKLDFSILDDAKFKSLKIFGESPVQPGATGRVDLFAPF